MNLRGFRKNRTATILTDYLILLGVVALALVAMQTYLKRGVQGRVKEMTDYFIGGKQVSIVDPTVHSISESNSKVDSYSSAELLEAGRTRNAGLDIVNVEASSRSVAQESEIKNPDYLSDGTTEVHALAAPGAQTE